MRPLSLCIFALMTTLSGCATDQGLAPRSVFDYYDLCDSTWFTVQIECMRTSRKEKCETAGSCSAIGNAAVAYGEALAARVDAKEITDAKARQEFASYRSRVAAEIERSTAAIDAAANAAVLSGTANALSQVPQQKPYQPPPQMTCRTYGNATYCQGN